jgi:hypothetical protein
VLFQVCQISCMSFAITSLGIDADNEGDCPIYCAQLVETEQAMRLPKPAGVHCSQLLDQYSCGPTLDLNFRSE